MSYWQLFWNNPAWVGVAANALFAIATIGVIVWQGCVMKAQVRVMRWQGHISARHERIQNRLIRLQHEHEWVLQKNRERKELLQLARKLNIAACCLEDTRSESDAIHWTDVQNTVHELYSRLNILDVATFSTMYDDWFPNLEQYADAVLKAVISEKNESPSPLTRKALHDAKLSSKPTEIFLALETAIRMEFFDFKNKWDAALPS